VLAWLATSAPAKLSGRVINHADKDAQLSAHRALPAP